MKKKLLSLILALAVCLSLAAPALAVGSKDATVTRGQVRDAVLAAADAYNPDVTADDVLKGYPDGTTCEDNVATRVETLVMLARAFGQFPALAGDTAMSAWPEVAFTDIPDWAAAELAPVLQAGVVVDEDTTFGPDDAMTRGELDTLLARVYALMRASMKDDFYATVNRDWLATATVPAGYMMGGTFVDLAEKTDEQLAELIDEVVKGTPAKGSAEDKIKTLYQNVLDFESRNAQGIEPIKPWLDAIDAASTVEELVTLQNTVCKETGFSLVLAYGTIQDLEDTTRQVLAFVPAVSPLLPAEYYASPAVTDFVAAYYAALLALSGETEEQAAADAARYVALEAELGAASLTPAEQNSIELTYNQVPAADVKAMFPNVDLDEVREADGFHDEDVYIITDKGALEYVAGLFVPERLEDLRLVTRMAVVSTFGKYLSHDFWDAVDMLNAGLFGVEPVSDEKTAVSIVMNVLSEYLGQTYVEKYFSAKAKADVEDMIDDILDTYAKRIKALDWMSEATKAKAIEKLEAITVNVGYPDEWDDFMDSVELKSFADGGSYFANRVAINKASRDDSVAHQDDPVDKTAWSMNVYEVNAYYMPTANSINFPAGILQAPFYDVNASRAANLGGIGYVIAHEITHAFDDQGAQFDAEGNMKDWWTEEDYTAFSALCDQVVEYYDGVEVIPGVACDGALTLGENIADLGAVACITQIEGEAADPDYVALYTNVATVWRTIAGREAYEYYAVMDEHGPNKLRVNRVLQSMDPFYTAFGITEGDGMWVAPEDRVIIW